MRRDSWKGWGSDFESFLASIKSPVALMSSSDGHASGGAVTLDDIQHGVLAQAESVADFTIGLAGADKLKHFGRKTIRLHSLAKPPPEHNASFARGRDARADSLAQ